MASFALAPPTDTGLIRAPPKPLLLVAIALAGCAAAGFSVVLALTSDHVREPEVQAALIVWVILAYVLAGVIAWWRRPESRLGPLMIAAGFGTFVSMLGWSNSDCLRTIGQTLDFLPPILFLHVFLAYPSGRLERPSERVIVAAAYVTGIGLGVVRMLLGGFGPRWHVPADERARRGRRRAARSAGHERRARRGRHRRPRRPQARRGSAAAPLAGAAPSIPSPSRS